MTAPLGVVVAGGLGTRVGAPKAGLQFGDRPLISYPLAALGAVCDRVVVVCKRDTPLPPLAVERWDEPDEPRHPIAGLRHALERAGAPVLVCAADMPFVTPEALRAVAAALEPGERAAAAVSAGRLQPLLAAYARAALEPLRTADDAVPLRGAVEALAPVRVEVPAEVVFNVNTPADLAEAERRLRSG